MFGALVLASAPVNAKKLGAWFVAEVVISTTRRDQFDTTVCPQNLQNTGFWGLSRIGTATAM